MQMPRRVKIILIFAASVLILAALTWALIQTQTDAMQWVCDAINAHGYSVSPSALSYEGSASNDSIRSLLGDADDISVAVDASRSAGFPSDVDRVGDIVLVMGFVNDEEVVSAYIMADSKEDVHIELCFIQNYDTGEVRPLS